MPQGRKDKNEATENKPQENPENDVNYDEEGLDEAVEETFPASDPIAPQDPGRGVGKGKRN